jgi:hypothetical protein
MCPRDKLYVVLFCEENTKKAACKRFNPAEDFCTAGGLLRGFVVQEKMQMP